MALSKTLRCALVLLTVFVEIESRECYNISFHRCEKYCCGKEGLYQCRDDCEGIACDNDDNCGSGCCQDLKCGDCPLSITIIGILAGSGVVVLIILIVVSICCRSCCQSQPRPMVVGHWTELHNANSIQVANPAVSVAHTSSNVYMQH